MHEFELFVVSIKIVKQRIIKKCHGVLHLTVLRNLIFYKYLAALLLKKNQFGRGA